MAGEWQGNGMETAWERHGMYVSALNVPAFWPRKLLGHIGSGPATWCRISGHQLLVGPLRFCVQGAKSVVRLSSLTGCEVGGTGSGAPVSGGRIQEEWEILYFKF
jgi:hypothetical protein